MKPKKGSENSSSVLNEDDVLHIYSLIKKYYSNNEIFELYKNKCKISTIKALRTGQNWSHMFKENFDKPIESLKCEKTGYNTRVKLKIVDLIFKNYSLEYIHNRFKLISKYDLKRISNNIIWKPIIKAYNEIKRPHQAIDEKNSSEFGETPNSEIRTIPSQA